MPIDVGIPSGYFASYAAPPCSKDILAISARVRSLCSAAGEKSLGRSIRSFQPSELDLRTVRISSALRSIVQTRYSIEWSAD